MEFWGRGRFSKRSASPPDPLSRRVAGNRLGFSSRLARPCSLGAFSCFSVMVTAADRAAATCQRWPLYSWRGDRAKVSKGRSQSPLARPQTRPPKSPAAEGAVSRRLTEDTPPSRVRRRGPHAARPRRLCQPPWTQPQNKKTAPPLHGREPPKEHASLFPAALREGARGRSFSQRSCLPRCTPVLLTSPVFSLSPT